MKPWKRTVKSWKFKRNRMCWWKVNRLKSRKSSFHNFIFTLRYKEFMKMMKDND